MAAELVQNAADNGCLVGMTEAAEAQGERKETSLYQILQILSLTLFEKTPILRALQTFDLDDDSAENRNQPILFDF